MVDLSSILNSNVNTGIVVATSFVTGFLMGRTFKSATKSVFNKSNIKSVQNTASNVSKIEVLRRCTEPLKLVLVLRQDLKLTKGKVASQCAHGTLIAYNRLLEKDPAILQAWEMTGQAKVVVRAPNIEELHSIEKEASKVGVITSIVHDAGKTQVDPGTATVMAVGPGPVSLIDKVTGHLKLY